MALERALQTTLDDAPLIVQRGGEQWCCMLCKRQFETQEKLCKHLTKSSLHAENTAAAGSRLREVSRSKRPIEEGGGDEPPAKRPPAAGSVLPMQPGMEPAVARQPPPGGGDLGASASGSGDGTSGGGGSGGGGGMSALEQMALFEKRLKSQAKRMPEKIVEPEDPVKVDSNKARTINNQMDWECSGCGTFNFARTITCITCKKHVDSTTKYLSNRLKEIKRVRVPHLEPQPRGKPKG